MLRKVLNTPQQRANKFFNSTLEILQYVFNKDNMKTQ